MEATLMACLLAEFSGGKSSIKMPIKLKENPKDQLAQWTRRGLILIDDTKDEYVKSEKYLSKHDA